MKRLSSNIRDIGAARRGQIVQRVLVDGWTASQAATVFGLPERQVTRWVAAYRRYGMASLHDAGAAERAPRRWWRRLRAALWRMSAGWRGEVGAQPARCIVLRKSPRGPRPVSDRRSLWN